MSDQVVVMDRGKVVQVGTPGEIYRQPATASVADFPGFLEGILLTRDGEQICLA